jgi:hypothetical protein
MITDTKLTLVLYPNTHGIAYVLCENPKKIIDFGLKTISRKEYVKWVRKAKELIDFGQPELVLLMDRPPATLSKRTHLLLLEIEKMALEARLSVIKITRERIRNVFQEFKTKTKYEIARTIVNWYPQLKSRMPYERKDWLAEHYQMGVFDAFSLMITHYYYKD